MSECLNVIAIVEKRSNIAGNERMNRKREPSNENLKDRVVSVSAIPSVPTSGVAISIPDALKKAKELGFGTEGARTRLASFVYRAGTLHLRNLIAAKYI
jgi:hypothetical protein